MGGLGLARVFKRLAINRANSETPFEYCMQLYRIAYTFIPFPLLTSPKPHYCNVQTSPFIIVNYLTSNMPNQVSRSRTAIGKREKTILCKHWIAKNDCPHGTACSFAHGYDQLRFGNVGKKYKTQKCQSFHNKPFVCELGARCCFIHDEPLAYLRAIEICHELEISPQPGILKQALCQPASASRMQQWKRTPVLH